MLLSNAIFTASVFYYVKRQANFWVKQINKPIGNKVVVCTPDNPGFLTITTFQCQNKFIM